MVKKAKPRDSKKIRQLKKKIHNVIYLRHAISGLALLLANEILG